MKLLWATNHQSIILVAETYYEVAFAEMFLDGMNYDCYKTTKKGGKIVGAEYNVIPDVPKKV